MSLCLPSDVLIIEDDSSRAKSIESFLQEEEAAIVITHCADYSEVRQLLDSGRLGAVEAVVLSMSLSERRGEEEPTCRTGLRVLKELRNAYSFKKPVVVLTRTEDSEETCEALMEGCSGYISIVDDTVIEASRSFLEEVKAALVGDSMVVSSNLEHLVLPEQIQAMSTHEICALAVKSPAAGAALHILESVDQMGPGPQRTELREIIKKDLTQILMQHLSNDPAWAEIRTKIEASEKNPATTETRNRLAGLASRNQTPFLVKELLEKTPRPIIISDDNQNIVFVNHATEELLSSSSMNLVGMPITDDFPELASHEERVEIARCSGNGEELSLLVESSMIKKDDSFYTVHVLTDLTSQRKKERQLREKLTALKESSTKLQQLVNTDPLTDLLNRRGLDLILKRETSVIKRNGSDLTALLIDLDNFKSINDTYGHAVGDLVLTAVAKASKDCLRGSDWLGRVGGDEFLVLLPDTSLDDGAMIAERIRLSVASTILSADDEEMSTTTSIGVVSVSPEAATIEEILELTKAGLKSSKKSGKNAVTVTRDGEESLHSKLTLEYPMLQSLKEYFRIEHQPIYHLSTNAIAAVELFTRGPTNELTNPDMLFKAARESEMLTSIDIHCLKSSLAYARRFSHASVVHINIFPSTLSELPAEKLLALTAEVRKNQRICLELSQRNMTVDYKALFKKIQILRDSGFLFALDDVGYGGSPLEVLALFAPNCIKIDMSLVRGMSTDEDKTTTVANIAKMAQSLGCISIAEGVETKSDLEALMKAGIRLGQGWLWRKTTALRSTAERANLQSAV